MTNSSFPSSMTRRGLLIGGAACLFAAGVASGQPREDGEEDAESRFFRLAAGPFGGVVFSLATGLATNLSNPPGGRGCDRGGSCGVPGLIVVAQSAAQGASQALDLLRGGQADAALVFSYELQTWLAGGNGGAANGLRTIATLSAEILHVFVRQDDSVETLANLRGESLALAQGPDAGTELARKLLASAQLLKPGQRAQLMPLEFALDALAEGTVRAVLATLWPGNTLVTHRARSLPLKLVPASLTEIAPLAQIALTPEKIPGALYPGVAGADSFGQPILLVTRADMPDAFVEAFVKSLWAPTTLKALGTLGPIGRFSLPRARGISLLPYHPGAETAYAMLLKKNL